MREWHFREVLNEVRERDSRENSHAEGITLVFCGAGAHLMDRRDWGGHGGWSAGHGRRMAEDDIRKEQGQNHRGLIGRCRSCNLLSG